jgi:hypothetical protein
MKHNRNDLSGQKFNSLTVIKAVESRVYASGWTAAMWLCHCDCGAQKAVRAMDLRRGAATSCGCLQREKARKRATTHGKTGSPEHRIWTAARDRHLRRGIPFTITLDDISIPTHCPVFRFEMQPHTNQADPTSPSLDRIDPSRGYHPDNIAVISYRANTLKRDATLTELQAVLRYLKRGRLLKRVAVKEAAPRKPWKNKRHVWNRSHGETNGAKRGSDRYELWRGAKQRAKKKGVPFEINVRGITIPKLCPVLGIELKPNVGGKTGSPHSPSLDRYNPALGYVVGNVAVISNRANLLKSDATPTEMMALVAWLGTHKVL